MLVQKIHHVAYRCKDAKETVDWYVKHLDMKFVLAIAENEVPSTKAPDPYMHVFLDAGDGNVHTNIPVNSDDYEMLQTAHEAVDRIMVLARSLDGVISGEHGIGTSKKKWLPNSVRFTLNKPWSSG
jgi:FAD/FMN-containing dehydrogenase